MVRLTDYPPPAAVSTIHTALVRDQEQDTVGVPVREPFVGRIDRLVDGVGHLILCDMQFVRRRYALLPHGTIRIVRIHERGVVRRDGHPEILRRVGDLPLLLIGKVDNLAQRLDFRDPVPDLPLPVGPLLERRVLPQGNVLESPHHLAPFVLAYDWRYMILIYRGERPCELEVVQLPPSISQ